MDWKAKLGIGGRKPGGKDGSGADDTPRRHTRHPAKGVTCPLGAVHDLSAGGMCLECKGKPSLSAGEATKVKLRTSAGAELVPVRVCWVKRKGLRGGWQVGLKFMGISQSQQERLKAIAKYGFIPEVDAEAQAATAEEALKKKVADAAAAAAASAGRPVDGSEVLASSAGMMAQIIRDNHPKVLGLEDDADMDAIRHAYRRKARACHPDLNPGPEALEKFMLLQEAYDALKRDYADAA